MGHKNLFLIIIFIELIDFYFSNLIPKQCHRLILSNAYGIEMVFKFL